MLKAVGRPHVMFGIHAIKKSRIRIILLNQLCNRAYYAKANSPFYERLSDPLFVIFPEEKTWAMDNLPENVNLYFVNEKDKAWTIHGQYIYHGTIELNLLLVGNLATESY